jgi:hypothetical protein
MKVVDHAEGAWTLYRLGQDLFLEVTCRGGTFAYSVLVRLDGTETHAYGMGGREYATSLAAGIRASMAAGASPYSARDVAGLYSDKVAAAMEAWHARPADTSAGTQAAPSPDDGTVPT